MLGLEGSYCGLHKAGCWIELWMRHRRRLCVERPGRKIYADKDSFLTTRRKAIASPSLQRFMDGWILNSIFDNAM